MSGHSLISEDAKKIEEFLQDEKEATIQQLAKILSLSIPTTWRRMQELLSQGTVERIGQTRGAKYRYKQR